MVVVTKPNIKKAFAWALEIAGMAKAQSFINELLDEDEQELFKHFFIDEDSFIKFRKEFMAAVVDVFKAMRWADQTAAWVDGSRNDPETMKYSASIRSYYFNHFEKLCLESLEKSA